MSAVTRKTVFEIFIFYRLVLATVHLLANFEVSSNCLLKSNKCFNFKKCFTDKIFTLFKCLFTLFIITTYNKKIYSSRHSKHSNVVTAKPNFGILASLPFDLSMGNATVIRPFVDLYIFRSLVLDTVYLRTRFEMLTRNNLN